jgi:hypothetical protein
MGGTKPTPYLPTSIGFLDADAVTLIGGLCASLAVIISLVTCYLHVKYYNKPDLQKPIVRIILIVPIYAIGSFFSIVFPELAVHFDLVRDMYEALCLYSFFMLMLEYCGGENQCALKMIRNPGMIKQPVPLCCLPHIKTDNHFLRTCKRGVIQFVVIKPLFAIISLVMLMFDEYDNNIYRGIMLFVYNASISYALYVLAIFYMGAKPHLVGCNAVKKFLAVKMVVFFTFWQLLAFNFVPGWTYEDIEYTNNFILCVEMLFFAILHTIAYSHKEFKSGIPDTSTFRNAAGIFSVRDVVQDTYHSFMPSYQDYVLTKAYNGAPEKKFRARTFIIGNLDDSSTTGVDAEGGAADRQGQGQGQGVRGSRTQSVEMDVFDEHLGDIEEGGDGLGFDSIGIGSGDGDSPRNGASDAASPSSSSPSFSSSTSAVTSSSTNNHFGSYVPPREPKKKKKRRKKKPAPVVKKAPPLSGLYAEEKSDSSDGGGGGI